VPNVVGKQLAAASQELQADKLRSNVVKYVASGKPTGTVLTQDPVAPQMVKAGTVVNLTVSGTQTETPVPNVIGISPAAAGSLLTSNNLTVGNQTSVCSSNAGAGFVAGQSPAAGTQVPPNTPVNLQVSTGPCTAVVPSVVGNTQSQASAAIGAVPGLSAAVAMVDCTSSGGTPGTVQSQTPTGGTTVNTPATVTLNVCSQPTTTTSSSTTTTMPTPPTP
jgi:serine/threonine-protein kinase